MVTLPVSTGTNDPRCSHWHPTIQTKTPSSTTGYVVDGSAGVTGGHLLTASLLRLWTCACGGGRFERGTVIAPRPRGVECPGPRGRYPQASGNCAVQQRAARRSWRDTWSTARS